MVNGLDGDPMNIDSGIRELPMKSKAIFLAVLTVLLITTGIAWAAQQTSDQEQPPAAPTEAEAQAPSAAELLESMTDAEKVETTGACCVAECRDAWAQCKDACGGGDLACSVECREIYVSCKSAC